MEITNICPYCGGEMREGALPGVQVRAYMVSAQ